MNLRETLSKVSERLTAPRAHGLTEALFLRLLGLIYIAAFASLWPQIVGLVGSHGISPAVQLMTAMRGSIGTRVYWEVPSLFWLSLSDRALVWFCALGCVAGVLLVLGWLSRGAALICFVLYLSLVTIGQPFMGFQWDALLLESGFLALFAGASWLVWAYRFLLFRLIFESGIVKLASHDPNWRNFHALRFHFMTQPLPDPVSYYAYRLPTRVLDAMTAATLWTELAAPFLLWLPRRLRQTGVALIVLLQLMILLTGNYAFFNLLTLALCMWGLDDQTFAPLERMLRWRPVPFQVHWPAVRVWRIIGNLGVAALIAIGAIQLLDMFRSGRAFSAPIAALAPLEIVNSYGLFAVMTTTRPEIVIEGSDDRTDWKEYSFPYKPGNTHRELPLVAPYQPRLDWQMWFAALGSYDSNTWVGGLLYRLLTGEPAVIGLLNPPPFTKPPHYIRALLYDYDFTTPAERSRTGAVWTRQLKGIWFGPVSLRTK
jgi:lipase maturation factor 1